MINRIQITAIFSLLCLMISGCAIGQQKAGQSAAKPIVKAVFSETGPKVDGRDGPTWEKARATKIKMLDTGETVEVKAVYTKHRVYFQAKYPDKSHDYIDRPWVYNGTSWKQIGQQDSMAYVWNIDNSIRGFNERGFAVLTTGLEENRHPWEIAIDGGKSKDAPAWFKNQKGDFWSTGLQLPYGKAEDWVIRANTSLWEGDDWLLRILNQHDEYPESAPWVLNKASDWSKPIWALRPGLTIKEAPYPVAADMVDISGHTPVAGEMQPFIVYKSREARWGGSKDDVDGAETWTKGFWTVEMGRPLQTGRDDDIQFAPEKGLTYTFGLLIRREGSRYEPTGPVQFVFDD